MPREATWLDGKGGHIALDVVNTVSWRHDPARVVDRLDGPEAVAAWTAARSLPIVADATAAEVAALRTLREAIHALVLVRAGGDGTRSSPGAAAGAAHETLRAAAGAAHETLRAAAATAVSRAELDLCAPARWRVPVTDAASLHDHLALAAVDLLATADPARLHACAEHDCGWVFLDTSRSGTRRFCDPAGCGNRARARRHHARHRRSPA